MSNQFTDLQPKDGECVLTCAHWSEASGFRHFYHLGQFTSFTRPDGTHGASQWLVLCHSCFDTHADNPTAVIRSDAIWIGNEPTIKNVAN